MITSAQAASPDSPINGVKALPKVGAKSREGSLEHLFRPWCPREEPPAGLSPAWPLVAFPFPAGSPSSLSFQCYGAPLLLQLHQTLPFTLCPTQSLSVWCWEVSPASSPRSQHTDSLPFNYFILFYFFVFLPFLGPLPWACGGSQARSLIGAVATGLRHSHSNVGSKPCLRPTPQLIAMLDP